MRCLSGTLSSSWISFPAFKRRSLSLWLVEDLVNSLDTGESPRGGVRLSRDITEMILAFIESHRRGGARIELPLVDVNLRHKRLKPPKNPMTAAPEMTAAKPYAEEIRRVLKLSKKKGKR